MLDWDTVDLNKAPTGSPVARGGVLNPANLLNAYRAGVFPWYSEGQPIQWWCPHPRFVLLPESLKVSQSLRKTERKAHWETTVDQDFEGVMRACAATPRPGQDGTWITEAMIQAYVELHRRGHAHSVEVRREGKLIGGLYGVSVGKVFCGESMFHHEPDASKVGFVRLMQRLRGCDFGLVDCQVPTEHLASLGAIAVTRSDFLGALKALRDVKPKGMPWASPLSPLT
jgi:leucyl/phenylalanyl-tRNA--protein transferase